MCQDDRWALRSSKEEILIKSWQIEPPIYCHSFINAAPSRLAADCFLREDDLLRGLLTSLTGYKCVCTVHDTWTFTNKRQKGWWYDLMPCCNCSKSNSKSPEIIYSWCLFQMHFFLSQLCGSLHIQLSFPGSGPLWNPYSESTTLNSIFQGTASTPTIWAPTESLGED